MSHEQQLAGAFVPDPSEASHLRLGGRPTGFDTDWPICTHCDQPMSFVLRLPLQNPVRLSERFEVGYFFICQDRAGRCDPYFASHGSNRLILQERAGPTSPRMPEGVSALTPMSFELRPRREVDRQYDLKTREMMADLFRAIAAGPEEPERRFGASRDSEGNLVVTPPDELQRRLEENYRHEVLFLGGEPEWLQSPDWPQCPCCGDGVRLLAQLDEFYLEAVSAAEQLPFHGRLFLFACERDCCTEGAALWQV